MKRIFFIIVGCLFLLWVVSPYFRTSENKVTIATPVVTSPPIITPPFFELTEEWQNLDQGMDIRRVSYQYNNQPYAFQIIRVNPENFAFRFEYAKEGKTLNEWKKNVQGVVINAGFFKEENEPVGLLYIDGERIDDHRSSLRGTGLLTFQSNQVEILDLSKQPLPSDEDLINALQTFPMLISKGEVTADTALVKEDRRTAVGIDAQNNVYLITAEYPHLGLFEFAQLLNDSGIPFTEVLNLDGGGSTGIAISTEKYQRTISSLTLIPTVLIVEKRE